MRGRDRASNQLVGSGRIRARQRQSTSNSGSGQNRNNKPDSHHLGLETGLEPWLSVCRALSGSVGTLSGLCRDSVGTLSVDNCRASVGLCRPLSADPESDYAWNLSTSVNLSRLCRSVGLSVCRPLSVFVDELSGSVEGSQLPLRVKVTSPFNPKAPF